MGKGKCISSDVRDMVVKVMTFFENEKKDISFRIPFDQAMKRTALATGIAERTLGHIKHDLKNKKSKPETENDLLVPMKGKRQKQKLKIDDAMITGIKKIINDFYTVKGEEPTLKKVYAAAKQELNFPGQKKTLWRILQSKGYRFEKSANVPEFTAQNSMTLISMGEEVRERKPVLEATYSHPLGEPSTNLTITSVSENGCTSNMELVECKTENINDDIDVRHSPQWHDEKTEPTLDDSKNICTDNSMSNKNNMQKWLHAHNIGYENVPIDFEKKIKKED